jgi:hypothetical protein
LLFFFWLSTNYFLAFNVARPLHFWLACPHVGQWHLLFSLFVYFIVWHSRVLRNFFRKKVNKTRAKRTHESLLKTINNLNKLSTAPFARVGSAFTLFTDTAKAKVEFEVQFGCCV